MFWININSVICLSQKLVIVEYFSTINEVLWIDVANKNDFATFVFIQMWKNKKITKINHTLFLENLIVDWRTKICWYVYYWL